MPTEHTSLKNTTPAGDSNTTNEMVVGKSKIYQRSFLIVAGSLLALLVLIAIAGTSGGQHLKSSTVEIIEGAVALADYQLDSANLGLTTDIFDLGAASENDEECGWGITDCCHCGPGGCAFICNLSGNCGFHSCCGPCSQPHYNDIRCLDLTCKDCCIRGK